MNIKTAKTAACKIAARRTLVCLSDASRIWQWDRPLVLVVGLYSQQGSNKVFHTVYEFYLLLDDAERRQLFGGISFDEVLHFHNELKNRERFGLGKHVAARSWAKEEKRRLGDKAGFIQLNPKIDSKLQRRLQCSILLDKLNSTATVSECFNAATGGYRGLALPFTVESSAREFR